MCYFGVPVAHEDSAARALRAGLAIIDVVAELEVKVRIGIVTGQVWSRRGSRSARPFISRHPAFIAEPGTLAVSDSARQIVKEQFDFQLLDRVPQLKGFDGRAGRLPRARRIPD